jgi:hypothetical protein
MPELFKSTSDSSCPVKHTTNPRTKPSVLVVDTSGSTVFDSFGNLKVLEKISDVIQNLPEQEFRVILWNARGVTITDPRVGGMGPVFVNGIYNSVAILKKPVIKRLFKDIIPLINSSCLTEPHHGIANIPQEWLGSKIYLIVDGQMQSNEPLQNLKKYLASSIKQISLTSPETEICIIVVQAKDQDLNNTEVANVINMAGGDVYDTVQKYGLTDIVTEFKVFTPVHHKMEPFIHIQNIRVPAGYIPFGKDYFSFLNAHKFIPWLYGMIQDKRNDEDGLTRFVQMLVHTLRVMTKDMPDHMQKNMKRMFADLFNDTSLGSEYAIYMIDRGIEAEKRGAAAVFADFKDQRKNFFKQADIMLTSGGGVLDSLGFRGKFMTFPIFVGQGNERKVIILTGHTKLVSETLALVGRNFPNSGIMVDGRKLPVLPVELKDFQQLTGDATISEQCSRQYIRALISTVHQVNVQDDIAFHIFLGYVVLGAISCEISPVIKNSLVKNGWIMLRKKKANSATDTELSRMEQGFLPVPNSGKINQFIQYMARVNEIFGFGVKPLTVWYCICLALRNEKVITTHYRHCQEDIASDFPELKDPRNLLDEIKKSCNIKMHEHTIPIESVLEYECPIEGTNTSESGGWMIQEHKTVSSAKCQPYYVISDPGYQKLISGTHYNCRCIVCLTPLTCDNFVKVGKKPVLTESGIFGPDDRNVFEHTNTGRATSGPTTSGPATSGPATIGPATSGPATIDPDPKSSDPESGARYLVIPRGTVGAGKSTILGILEKKIVESGGMCIVEGTDKYCKTGTSIKNAIANVSRSFNNFQKTPSNGRVKVVCVDTCNERVDQKIFGQQFIGYQRLEFYPNFIPANSSGYYAWSLYNVLARKSPQAQDNHYLNPWDAGVTTCLTVHRKKASALPAGTKYPDLFAPGTLVPVSPEQAMAVLKPEADAYRKMLDEQYPVEKQIDELLKRIFGN